jgi:hypothetical protein
MLQLLKMFLKGSPLLTQNLSVGGCLNTASLKQQATALTVCGEVAVFPALEC